MMIENPTLLIVDHNEADGLLARIVFERAGFALPIQSARDGAEAIAYLKGEGVHGDRTLSPLPSVILLELKLPRKDGFEVLTWLRQQPALKRLQVYILSESSRPEDIRHAYDLGANSYMVKPGNIEGLTQTARILFSWLKRSHFAPLDKAGPGYERAAPIVSIKTPDAPSETVEGELKDARRQNEGLLQRIEQLDAELKALQAQQVQVAKIVRHDVRTPLMTIGGYTDLLVQSSTLQFDDKSQLYLLKIAEATDQLTRLLSAALPGPRIAQHLDTANGTAVHASSVV